MKEDAFDRLNPLFSKTRPMGIDEIDRLTKTIGGEVQHTFRFIQLLEGSQYSHNNHRLYTKLRHEGRDVSMFYSKLSPMDVFSDTFIFVDFERRAAGKEIAALEHITEGNLGADMSVSSFYWHRILVDGLPSRFGFFTDRPNDADKEHDVWLKEFGPYSSGLYGSVFLVDYESREVWRLPLLPLDDIDAVVHALLPDLQEGLSMDAIHTKFLLLAHKRRVSGAPT